MIRRSKSRAAFALGALVLAACVNGTLPPMGANDPASPKAPESPSVEAPSPEPSSIPGMPGMDPSHMHDHPVAPAPAPS